MYQEYYGLREEPFKITPDPRYLFLTRQHQEALNHLLYGIQHRKGFMCLTGEVGAGKTTLCRRMLESLADDTHTALVLNPMLTEAQLMRAICQEFDLGKKRRDTLGYINLLNEFLLETNLENRNAVVIIDEAQDMPDKTLEMCRLLSNLETNSHKLLQIVLVGQPELREKLDKPKFRQLSQRITVRFHLGKMNRAETADYLAHRLHVASNQLEIVRAEGEEAPEEDPKEKLHFDRGAVKEIFRFSHGTPRLVNAIGDKALLAGFVYRQKRINKALVKRAIRELKEAG
ncbi:MAG: ExeA family protein [Phycisphaerae bacterium]